MPRRHGLAAIAIAIASLLSTVCRKAPPPRAGGHRHCSAATGWRAATHAHFSPTHTRALPETFWTFLRARNQSHKPCKSWIISVFAVGLLGVFSVSTHPAPGLRSIARKAAMTSGCLLAIDLSTTNDTLVLYKGSWNTVILAASLDMTLPPIRAHSSKVVTGLPNPMMYNACTTQSSPATGWCNRPKVSSTTMCESLQACGPSTAVKALPGATKLIGIAGGKKATLRTLDMSRGGFALVSPRLGAKRCANAGNWPTAVLSLSILFCFDSFANRSSSGVQRSRPRSELPENTFS